MTTQGNPPAGTEGQTAKDNGNAEGQEPAPVDVAALQRQLQIERESRRKFEGKLADYEVKFQAFEGIDPDEIRTIREEKKRLEEQARQNDPKKLDEHYKGELAKLSDKFTK